MTSETWAKAREALAGRIGRNNYLAWIEPLEFSGIRDGVAQVEAPTTFIADWVSRNFADEIRAALAAAGAPVRRLQFTVVPARRLRPLAALPVRPNGPAGAAAAAPGLPPGAAGAARGASGPAAVDGADAAAPDPGLAAGEGRGRGLRPRPRGAEEGELPGSPLEPRLTFETFVVGKPNALAHAAARRVAEQTEVSFNPLFFYGGVGLGKTHLMQAIAWELRGRWPERKVLYLSAEKFMFSFINALRDKSIMEFKSLFRSVDVLLVDDVQFIAGKDSTQEEFFHTFNALVDLNRQIVLSADRAPGEIKDLEERIKSRLHCGLVVDLHPTDYELRLGVLQNRLDWFRQQYPGIVIGKGVPEFLAHSLNTNVRVLEGAMNRLCAFGSLIGREITVELAQDCLADLLRTMNRRISIEEIQKKVAEHYNVRFADLIGPRRVRTLARPRQVAMYLSKELTARSLPEIARRFGGRDHTTIMHGIRRVEELRRTDPQIAEDIELLRRVLQS